ncbi:hypothetical protein LINPERHAP1_LOCUS30467 [Linum perenne]
MQPFFLPLSAMTLIERSETSSEILLREPEKFIILIGIRCVNPKTWAAWAIRMPVISIKRFS